MVAGLLLARAGVGVVVLEKHADFLRDFRGDTVHPSTLEVFAELGLLEALLALPHSRVETLGFFVEGRRYRVADLTRLPGAARFIAMMPQWDLLDFIGRAARRYPNFTLCMAHEATGLRHAAGRIAGVTGHGPAGAFEIAAPLTLLADGRGSMLRGAAGLVVDDIGAPIDVLWFALPKAAGDAPGVAGRLARGRFLIQIDRGDYWQCAWVVAKGGAAALKARSFADFAGLVGDVAPELRARVAALGGWDALKLLTVTIDRLRRWWTPGLLAIGDAAHAMSPVGGVGINLAVQDAVAAARILGPALARDADATPLLARVEARRSRAVRWTQAAQVIVQRRIIVGALAAGAPVAAPLAFRLLDRFAPLRRLTGRLIGLGVQPEHVARG